MKNFYLSKWSEKKRDENEFELYRKTQDKLKEPPYTNE